MKKIILLLTLLMFAKGFAATSYSTTCTTTWWWIAAYWGCTVNAGPCGSQSSFGGGCTASCSYCGSYFNPCDVATDLIGFCNCNSGWQDCNGGTDGCETQMGTNTNCASCGNDCTVNICSGNNALSGGTCSSGACTYSTTTNCDDSDGLYSGQYRDYYCSGGSCTYSTTDVDSSSAACSAAGKTYISGATGTGSNCCGDDGNSDNFYLSSGTSCNYCNNAVYGSCSTANYCSGSIYNTGGTCSSTGCSFSTQTNCATDYCSAGDVRNFNGQCTGTGCTYTTQDCDNSDGAYGTSYRDYSCTNGECTFTSTDPDSSSTFCANYFNGNTTHWISGTATGNYPNCCGDDGTSDDFSVLSGTACTYCNDGAKNTCSTADSCSGTVRTYNQMCSSTGCSGTTMQCLGNTYCADTNTLMTGNGCSNGACMYTSSSCSSQNGVYGGQYLSFSCTSGACSSSVVDPDTSQTVCEALGKTWAIGGVNNQCCGDDANEFVTTSTFAPSMDGVNSDLRACCSTIDSCAAGNTCTLIGSSRDADSDGDTDCCQAGNVWMDACSDANCPIGEFFQGSDCVDIPTPEIDSVNYYGPANYIQELSSKGRFSYTASNYGMKVSVSGTRPAGYYYEISRGATSVYIGNNNYFIDPSLSYSTNYCYKVRTRNQDGTHTSPYTADTCAKFCSYSQDYGVQQPCNGSSCPKEDICKDVVLTYSVTPSPTLCYSSGGVFNCQVYTLYEDSYTSSCPAEYNSRTLRVDLSNMNRNIPFALKVELKDADNNYHLLDFNSVAVKGVDDNGNPVVVNSNPNFLSIPDNKYLSVYFDLSAARKTFMPVSLYECEDGTARISIKYEDETIINQYLINDAPVVELDNNGNTIRTNNNDNILVFASEDFDKKVYNSNGQPLVIYSREYNSFGELVSTNYVAVTHDPAEILPSRSYDLMPIFWFDNGVLYGENGMECHPVDVSGDNCYCDIGGSYLVCDSNLRDKEVIESYYSRNLINDLDFSNNVVEQNIRWCIG